MNQNISDFLSDLDESLKQIDKYDEKIVAFTTDYLYIVRPLRTDDGYTITKFEPVDDTTIEYVTREVLDQKAGNQLYSQLEEKGSA